jgi:hypothetical protein
MRTLLDRQIGRTFVLEHLAEITAVYPAVAGRAPDGMLGLYRWRIAHTSAELCVARNLIMGQVWAVACISTLATQP